MSHHTGYERSAKRKNSTTDRSWERVSKYCWASAFKVEVETYKQRHEKISLVHLYVLRSQTGGGKKGNL